MLLSTVLTTSEILKRFSIEQSRIPLWILVMAGMLIVLFTVLLIRSPRGSNKRRGRRRTMLSVCILMLAGSLTAQISVERSVQIKVEPFQNPGILVLSWEPGINATGYEVSLRNGPRWDLLETLTAADTSYTFAGYQTGRKYEFRVEKIGGTPGFGYIEAGFEIPSVHQRGRCLMVIEKEVSTVEPEISMTMNVIEGDGWVVDSIHVNMDDEVTDIRSRIQSWYQENPDVTNTAYLLGHVPVPYSGNIVPDGHVPDHQGAWPADVYYGEMNGNWTDRTVNVTAASGTRNDNVPGDGKWDNSTISTDIEVQVGRVDFFDMPAFSESYLELTRNYLLKNIAFKTNEYKVKRRGLIENNFVNLGEGFGQNGWKNFSPMFGADSVKRGNYEVDLVNGDYLWAYACGGGSYTSMGGVGNTNNLYVEKDIQAVFVMNFGSYFGDWDRQNNLMRAALGSGLILTNAWAARPNWQFHTMALGQHIGLSALTSQNNSFTYESGFGSRSIHASLLGDPTLRLHAMEPCSEIDVENTFNSVKLSWKPSPDATEGYWVLREEGERGNFVPLTTEPIMATTYTDSDLATDNTYRYSVRAVKLERSASGSYYNTSIGRNVEVSLMSGLPNEVTFTTDSSLCFDSPDGRAVVMLDGGVGPFIYNWSNSDQDSIAENVIPGMYTVEVTSGLGASEVYGPIEVSGPDSITMELTITPSNGMDGEVIADITGGTPPYVLLWEDGSLDTAQLAPGFYDLLITDKNDCTKTIEFEVKMATQLDETLQSLITISPNPATDYIQLQADQSLETVHLVIYNHQGQVMMTDVWNRGEKLVSVEDWPSGVYQVKGVIGEKYFLKQVVIK